MEFYMDYVQGELFPPPSIPLEEVFEAYYSCRKNKRHTANTARFEVDCEANLFKLWNEINNGDYRPGTSLAFIVERPVKREIFAADFRDRIVHHLIINKINFLFERQFIYDSYACRVGKGTHFGIKRVDRFIRRESANYARRAWILKMDIKSFFMNIDQKLLFTRLQNFLREKYHEADRELIIGLCRKIVFSDPARHCHIRNRQHDWRGLPKDKSLFGSKKGCGLPIGNLTSQVFANFYLDPMDHFIKHNLGFRSYGRYVDDFIIVHPDRDTLRDAITVIRNFLLEDLKLILHPGKIYLEPAHRGVQFLGAVIKHNYILVTNRVKGNFHSAVERFNRIAEAGKPKRMEREQFQASLNSYLGILRHYSTAKLSHVLMGGISPWRQYLFRLGYINGRAWKFSRKGAASKVK